MERPWNNLVPAITYIIAAINSRFLTSLSFFLFVKVKRQKHIVMLLRKSKLQDFPMEESL